MHRRDSLTEALTQAITRYAVQRTQLDPPPLDHPRSPHELRATVGETITERGLGAREALRVFAEVLAPACISIDNPRFLSFVPTAPSGASILFDLVVSASSIYAGSWLEGAAPVFAENQALRTTNSIESLNRELRRRTKTQASFSTEEAAVTLLYGLVAFEQIQLRRICGYTHVAELTAPATRNAA